MSFASSNIPIPFTPLTIPGCVVWFDSADSTTISGSGTAAFQWRSKGATSLTASINAGVPVVAATCNSYPCIYFSNVGIITFRKKFRLYLLEKLLKSSLKAIEFIL